MIVSDLIKLGEAKLQKSSIDNARQESVDLLANCLDLSRSDLHISLNLPVDESVSKKFIEFIDRRSLGEPFAYIVGSLSFYGLTIKTDQRALIPRLETELLVDLIVKKLSSEKVDGKVFLDLCTGSGCIGLAIKRNYPELRVICSDISPEALSLAQENAKLNQLDIDFREGDLLDPIMGDRLDFIVCNPPYVSEGEYAELEKEVLLEPKQALVGGVDGLDYYKRLAKDMSKILNPGGNVWLEMGMLQGFSLKEIFSAPFWKKREIILDLSGKDRFFFLEKE